MLANCSLADQRRWHNSHASYIETYDTSPRLYYVHLGDVISKTFLLIHFTFLDEMLYFGIKILNKLSKFKFEHWKVYSQTIHLEIGKIS